VFTSSTGRVASWSRIAVFVFFVGYGAYLAWGSVVSRPHAYARLRVHGVPATARLAACGHFGGARGVTCRLQLSFRGRTRTWTYRNDTRQFHGLPLGAAVPVLVDSAHPETAYTVHDVQAGTNAGWGVLAFFGIGLAALGAAGLAWQGRLSRRPARP
jgi:hypothetical protein